MARQNHTGKSERHGMWSWNQAWCTYLYSLETMRGRKFLETTLLGTEYRHLGLAEGPAVLRNVLSPLEVIAEGKSHFPRLLISVSQSTLGLSPYVGSTVTCCGEKKLVLQHFLSSKGRRGKATIPDMWSTCKSAWGKLYLSPSHRGRGSWKGQPRGGDTSDGQLRFT